LRGCPSVTMVKIKALSRDKSEFQRQTKQEIVRAPRSLQPELHPFDKPREFQRALNTVKLNRHFAKPFVAALDGHKDGVCYMAKSEAELVTVCSGSTDGEIRRWNLTERATTWSVAAHTGFVRGIAFAKGGHHFVSASDDKTVKLWSASASSDETEPLSKWLGAHAFTHVDHHDKEHMFATGGPTVQLWDTSRSEAIQSFSWGADTVTRIRFNPVERSLLACLSNDRSITLYDVSSGSAMQKMTMQTRQNSICWNPMEPFHFTTAAEDHDLYTFDMRKLDHAICVHKGHVSAVLDVDYSPTGKQFVSGAYDKTLRIWEAAKPKSVQVYLTKRMQLTLTLTLALTP
jgi:WD repeat and SOF domain-containing protein 1